MFHLTEKILFPDSQEVIINNKKIKGLTLTPQIKVPYQFRSDRNLDLPEFKANWMNLAQLIFLQKADELHQHIEKEKIKANFLYLFSEHCVAICKQLENKEVTLLALSALRGPVAIISMVMDQTLTNIRGLNPTTTLENIGTCPHEHQGYIIERLFFHALTVEEKGPRLLSQIFITLGKTPQIYNEPVQIIERLFKKAQATYLDFINAFVNVKCVSGIAVEYLLGENVQDFHLSITLDDEATKLMQTERDHLSSGFKSTFKDLSEKKKEVSEKDEELRTGQFENMYKDVCSKGARMQAFKCCSIYEGFSKSNQEKYKEQYAHCLKVKTQ